MLVLAHSDRAASADYGIKEVGSHYNAAVTTGATPDPKANRLTWTGLALVLPAAIFWATLLIAGMLHQDGLAKPFLRLVETLHLWFVIGVLLVMPLLGGILAALGFRRHHMPLSIVVMLLGFAAAGLNILLQTAKQPVH